MTDDKGQPRNERPILFSGPMVRAILAGAKTQTRRILKPQPHLLGGYDGGGCWIGKGHHLRWAVGDRLWVRETWSPEHKWASTKPSEIPNGDDIWYWADGNPEDGDWAKPKPSIYMPRWASRITLDVTGVRVERLQDISEADAIAEGIVYQKPTADDLDWYQSYCQERDEDPATNPMEGVWIAPGTRQGYGMTKTDRDREQWGPTAAFAYRCTWDAINGPAAWDANPWVAVIEFYPVVKTNGR